MILRDYKELKCKIGKEWLSKVAIAFRWKFSDKIETVMEIDLKFNGILLWIEQLQNILKHKIWKNKVKKRRF